MGSKPFKRRTAWYCVEGVEDDTSHLCRMRIYHYYLPIFFWAEQQLKEHRRNGLGSRPLVIGIQAPQGCGKTTIVEELEKLFTYTGLRPAAVSIDDFYLTFDAQQALAKVGICPIQR